MPRKNKKNPAEEKMDSKVKEEFQSEPDKVERGRKM